MRFHPIERTDKLGRTIVLRSAEKADAKDLIEYMKITASETPFLLREPDEFSMTVEQEEVFLEGCIQHPRALMLIATMDGKHIGNCSFAGLGPFQRYSHRCDVAIALYQEYCNSGIGKIMLETVLSVAKETGYEQAELQVVAGNEIALSLYRKLGFEVYGTFPDNMKYADGSYADAYWMMKKL